MNNIKNDNYFIQKIIESIDFIINNTKDIEYEQFVNDDVITSAICFHFIQLSENVSRLSDSFVIEHQDVEWCKIKGLRNRIVHDYGNVQLDRLFVTIKNDLPELYNQLEKLI